MNYYREQQESLNRIYSDIRKKFKKNKDYPEKEAFALMQEVIDAHELGSTAKNAYMYEVFGKKLRRWSDDKGDWVYKVLR